MHAGDQLEIPAPPHQRHRDLWLFSCVQDIRLKFKVERWSAGVSKEINVAGGKAERVRNLNRKEMRRKLIWKTWVNPEMTGRWRQRRESSVQILSSLTAKTRHECVKMLTEPSKKQRMVGESVQSGENDTDVQGGLSLSTPVCPAVSPPLCPSLSSGGWHFPSSVWPLTEGGMNRGVEWGERAGWGVKGGRVGYGHLNARPPIYWKSERDTQKHRLDTHA